jgi:YidC/Oxa1 family membrane protein insertase
MSAWTLWLDAIRNLLHLLSSDLGWGVGLAIVAATLLLRTALLPLSWHIAYRGCVRQKKLMKLQPQLQRLKERFTDHPDVYLREMMELYRRHDMTVVDGKSILGAVAQAPLLLGMFQVLRHMGDGARFLWIQNLLRPDAILSVIAGVATALMIVVNPDIPEQMRLFMILVPSVIAIIPALQFSSALSVYWITSNAFTACQTFMLHAIVRRRIRTGVLKI